MSKTLLIFVVLTRLCLNCVSQITDDTFDEKLDTLKIGFGSCHDTSDIDSRNIWTTIEKNNRPDLWVWLGDIMYADRNEFNPTTGKFTVIDSIKENWRLLNNITEYTKFLRNLKYGFISVWDDHDFGGDNLGGDFIDKVESKRLYLDAMGFANDSYMRKREGVYSSKTYGKVGQQLKIVLLDIRYNRQPYGTPNGDFLGEVQWQWLIEEVASMSSNDVLILGSSIQVLADDKPSLVETWHKFEYSRRRLISLLVSANVSHLLIISGDIHYAEVLTAKVHYVPINNKPTTSDDVIIDGMKSYLNLIEVTSSGLTHSWGSGDGGEGLLGFFYSTVFFIGQNLLPWRYRRRGGRDWYSGLNYGIIDVTWDPLGQPTVHCSIFNSRGRSVINIEVEKIHNHGESASDIDSCVGTGGSIDQCQFQSRFQVTDIQPVNGRPYTGHLLVMYVVTTILVLTPWFMSVTYVASSFVYLFINIREKLMDRICHYILFSSRLRL